MSESSEQSIVLPAHLHARPAAMLAQAAAGFSSEMSIGTADRSVDPGSALSVMGLGAMAGSTVTVRAQGDDAVDAVSALIDILKSAE